ncbi:chalcone isomerase family protein [Holophaga foetida]|uniref:chalcone isomerase family protein n=1 Tax=Holophaga foetida TaxID=35839 RepID=UPI0002473F37|nr:chalcone isomerase family protein [Holophaga foetida]
MPIGIRTTMAVVLATGSMVPGQTVIGRPGWIHTGEGVREKNLALIHVQAYAISHWVRMRPPAITRFAMIDLEEDKQFTIRMLRDVGVLRMKGMFRDAFALNGYRDQARIETFLAALTRDLAKDDQITVAYTPQGATTSISLQGCGTATVQGKDFMRATWSIWFGQSDQPALGEALVSKLRTGK